MTTPADTSDHTATPRVPHAWPRAGRFAILTACIALIIGAIAGHDLAVHTERLSAPSFLGSVLNWASRLTTGPWVLPIGIVLVLLGIITLIRACLPAAHTHIPVRSNAAVWMRPVDVCRMCTQACQSIPGVTQAGTTCTANKVIVTFTTVGSAPANLTAAITAAVEEQLSYLDSSLALVVRNHSKEVRS